MDSNDWEDPTRISVGEKGFVWLEGEWNAVRRPRLVNASDAAPSSSWPTTCGFLCGNMVTPSVLQQAYQLGPAPTGPTNGSLAVAEFQGVMWDQAGLDHFSHRCGTPKIEVKQVGRESQLACKLIPIVGTPTCVEAMLDLEYISAVGGSIPLTDVFNNQYSLETWAKQLEAMADGELPLVHSVSYGNDEAQAPNTPSYMHAVDDEFKKLGLRGATLLVAAGDQGVWGREGSLGSNKFHPDFPASSPFVTAVGGTDFAAKGVVGEEKAWRDGGGGFSDTFAAPAYQASAVAAYLANSSALPTASYFNKSGRAYPDVAALGGEGNPYCVSVLDFMMGVAGTSASSPVVAGVIGKLNELRLGAGKPPMGFVNPFLYANPSAFHDVVLGENKGAGKFGFTAAPGWDPATGLGTPDYGKLATAAMLM